jgi:branched-chain amino acid transport system substrate-binding protein
MKLRKLMLRQRPRRWALAPCLHPWPVAQAAEQFFPSLVYRTGPYAPNGTPFANGYSDYLKLVNERGGINGVKIVRWKSAKPATHRPYR